MKRLPHLESAVIDARKITDYLLSPVHPYGRAKAQFFNRFGFALSAWEVLQEALQRHAQGGKVVKVEKTAFGTKYVIEGPLPTPDGRDPTLCAVWFLAKDKRAPHFVTAYPIRER
ncbi:conserved hypothetical protein (plasmid) [Nitrosococcus halophilus Nc 4]|uniref:DUF6883 domain-containing protein n=1 Tax=Nitrosococcus halophilus (strain Nc4) TaxID=472759 RepID=D5C5C5_NITHN|nr:DUF6883 domain-containing protein [Nitrosococcus halophilus]ADE16979.1 conserved hypothetical protein [Nitrosococcus halophilus Nc 4]